jgi:hypothetical protein
MAGPSTEDLRRDGGRFIAGLHQFQQAHGRYPVSLQEAGINPPVTRYGPWSYWRSEDGRQFGLSVGDYREDLFTLSYSSERRSWYLDE